MKGLFVTFEGPDGSGKTSIIKSVAAYFNKQGLKVLSTREPGGIRISEAIRDILLNPKHIEMDARTEALLFAASRRQHLIEKILPALEKGTMVLCDRFIDSSLVYQGIARSLGIDEVLLINKFAIEDHLPDLTIFVDVTPEVGLKRVFNSQMREVNRLDLETKKFHQETYEGYLHLLKMFPERIKRIDGEKMIDEVVYQAIQVIENFMKQRN